MAVSLEPLTFRPLARNVITRSNRALARLASSQAAMSSAIRCRPITRGFRSDGGGPEISRGDGHSGRVTFRMFI
jgi:hypothetical protein